MERRHVALPDSEVQNVQTGFSPDEDQESLPEHGHEPAETRRQGTEDPFPHVRLDIVRGVRPDGTPAPPHGGPGLDELILCTPRSGSLLLASEPHRRLDTGRLFLAASHRHLTTLSAQECELVVLRVSRKLVPCGDDALAGTVGRTHDATTGTAALLRPLLLALAVQDAISAGTGRQSDGSATRWGNLLADLTGCLVEEIAERTSGPHRVPSDGHGPVEEIRRWTNARLVEPDLCPSTVAAAHFMSVRRLHKLFEQQNGTLSRWVQHRRLEECRRELGRSDGRQVLVSSIAQRWGFATAAHFSRTFRSAYGMSPRAWRETRGHTGFVNAASPSGSRPAGEADGTLPKGA
ncbi:helix-turn-helix transcriptional regulator [Streptomyces sp. NPDC012825]|uniref:helix-turn-helix transcriptional regulator n=1 Tax=Streptomyces sp. NPDC012825 TaxID=3364851 RepID=UPI00369E4554